MLRTDCKPQLQWPFSKIPGNYGEVMVNFSVVGNAYNTGYIAGIMALVDVVTVAVTA